MKIFQFFQGPTGESSSKRLIGILSGICLIVLALLGGFCFLIKNDTENFLDLFNQLSIFSGYMLTAGLADNILIKKNENDHKDT